MMAENTQPPGDQPQGQQQEKPKIIIDDDWKAQARAEKEKLAEEVEKPSGAGAPAAAGRGRARELPPPTFSTLVNSLVTQTFMALGGVEDPRTHRRYVDLEVAKHHIDTLVMLEDKAKGNLTDEETKLLDQGLYESRMQYVNIAQRVATMPGT
jgi:hypothetical protein